MKDNQKFNIILLFLVVITVLSLMNLLKDSMFGDSSFVSAKISKSKVSASPVSLSKDSRKPGGYHYEWVKKLAEVALKKAKEGNPNLDSTTCYKAYFDYYAAQSKETVAQALSTIRICEK